MRPLDLGLDEFLQEQGSVDRPGERRRGVVVNVGDLAVEILTKMKNKNAAEILNMMDPEKAKHLSERFAGFKEAANRN